MKAIINTFKAAIMIICILFMVVIALELTRALARFCFTDADGGAIVGFLGGITLSFGLWQLLKK